MIKTFEPDHTLALKLLDTRKTEDVVMVATAFLRRKAWPVVLMQVDRGDRRMVSLQTKLVQSKGATVFDPTVFLRRIQVVRKPQQHGRCLTWVRRFFRFPEPEDEELYFRRKFWIPLLQSRAINAVYLTTDWRGDETATWYHNQAVKFKIEVRLLTAIYAKEHCG